MCAPAGVVDEDVEPAHAIEHTRHERVDRIAVLEIGDQSGRTHTVLGAERRGGLGRRGRARVQDDVGPGLRQGASHRRAEAARGARDERDTSGQIKG
jgi:hypothetical protein